MEVSQAERIVDRLIYVRASESRRSNLELDTRNHVAHKDDRVDPASKSQERQLKKDTPFFAVCCRQNIFQQVDLDAPGTYLLSFVATVFSTPPVLQDGRGCLRSIALENQGRLRRDKT